MTWKEYKDWLEIAAEEFIKAATLLIGMVVLIGVSFAIAGLIISLAL